MNILTKHTLTLIRHNLFYLFTPSIAKRLPTYSIHEKWKSLFAPWVRPTLPHNGFCGLRFRRFLVRRLWGHIYGNLFLTRLYLHLTSYVCAAQKAASCTTTTTKLSLIMKSLIRILKSTSNSCEHILERGHQIPRRSYLFACVYGATLDGKNKHMCLYVCVQCDTIKRVVLTKRLWVSESDKWLPTHTTLRAHTTRWSLFANFDLGFFSPHLSDVHIKIWPIYHLEMHWGGKTLIWYTFYAVEISIKYTKTVCSERHSESKVHFEHTHDLWKEFWNCVFLHDCTPGMHIKVRFGDHFIPHFIFAPKEHLTIRRLYMCRPAHVL